MSVNIYNAEEKKLAPLAGSSSYNSIVTSWEEIPSDTKIPSEKLVKDSISDLHCDIGNVRIGEVEDTSLGKHTHLMGFTSSSKSDPVIRYINYKEDGKSSSERLLLSYDSANEDLLIKGNANDKYTEFRLSDYAKQGDFDKGQISATTCTKNSVTTIPITFNKTFSSAPIVVATMVTNSSGVDVGNMTVAVMNITTTGATLYVYNNGATDRKPAFNWIAM